MLWKPSLKFTEFNTSGTFFWNCYSRISRIFILEYTFARVAGHKYSLLVFRCSVFHILSAANTSICYVQTYYYIAHISTQEVLPYIVLKKMQICFCSFVILSGKVISFKLIKVESYAKVHKLFETIFFRSVQFL